MYGMYSAVCYNNKEFFLGNYCLDQAFWYSVINSDFPTFRIFRNVQKKEQKIKKKNCRSVNLPNCWMDGALSKKKKEKKKEKKKKLRRL